MHTLSTLGDVLITSLRGHDTYFNFKKLAVYTDHNVDQVCIIIVAGQMRTGHIYILSTVSHVKYWTLG